MCRLLLNQKTIMQTPLKNLWTALSQIQSVQFTAQQSNQTSHGTGTIQVQCNTTEQWIDFHETLIRDQKQRAFDIKRWQFAADHVAFCRYRNGEYEPIFRFAYGEQGWQMQQEYWCEPDCYRGELQQQGDSIHLRVQIAGKNKAQIVNYVYTA
ncbi:Uncharacterised protein [Kingella kingae]|nr:Uncharacterised protein [Kingella kingae]